MNAEGGRTLKRQEGRNRNIQKDRWLDLLNVHGGVCVCEGDNIV